MALIEFNDADLRTLRAIIRREQTRPLGATNDRPVARYPSDFIRLMKAPEGGVPAATFDEVAQTITAGTAEASPQRIDISGTTPTNEIEPADDPEDSDSFDIPVYNFVQKEIKADEIFAVGRDAFGQYVVIHEQPKLILCSAQQVGGSQGTSSSQASWTYNVDDIESGETILSSVDVNGSGHPYERPDAGQLSQATFAIVYTGAANPPSAPAVVWLNEALITCPPETP
jgi:hypothetical protein